MKRNRYFIVFIILFAYAQSVHSRISNGGEFNYYTFTPDAAIATLISTLILFLVLKLFIHIWQRSVVFSFKEMLKIFGCSLIAYVFIVQLIGLFVAIIFGNLERNFNNEIFIKTTFSYLLDGFIYGSFFLVFYYNKKNKKQQEQLVTYNQALFESRMSHLKAQLNPHFLFNNLNILDQLIYEDKNKASAFLNEFAEIYRYVLDSTNKPFVSIQEELAFAERYFKLIKYKFQNSYQLKIVRQNTDGFIIPLTIQLLIENSVKHNLGTEDNPVCIEICINDFISVSNNTIPKRKITSESGKALNNLKEQYIILAKSQIVINKLHNQFSVTIPKINVH